MEKWITIQGDMSDQTDALNTATGVIVRHTQWVYSPNEDAVVSTAVSQVFLPGEEYDPEKGFVPKGKAYVRV